MLTRVGVLARIGVRGVVQGVGFRPFVYRLAHQYRLNGRVRNTSGSVEIEVEGAEKAVRNFLSDLEGKVPPVARIESVDTTFHPPKGYTEFKIEPSLSRRGQYQLVSPDIATCPDCREEIFSYRPAFWLPLHQLHQLRAALYHHRGYSLRPSQDDDAQVQNVPPLPAGV